MGARIEAQYMAALLMVEQQAAEAVEQERADIAASLEDPSSPFRLSLPNPGTDLDSPQFEYPATGHPIAGQQHSPSPGTLSNRVPRRSPSLISHMMTTQRQSTTSSGSEHAFPPALG